MKPYHDIPPAVKKLVTLLSKTILHMSSTHLYSNNNT